MAKKLLYIVFAVVVGFLVNILSVSINLQNKQIDLLTDAFKNDNYQQYLSYNTPFYSKDAIYQEYDENYHITVYSIIGEEEGEVIKGYTIFISKLNLNIFTISSNYDDTDDLTNMIVTSNDVEVYNHKEELKETSEGNISLTYGYSKFKGYYFIYRPIENGTYEINLYNYEGVKYNSFSINHNVEFDDTKSVLDLETYFKNNDNYNIGYSNEQKLNLIQKDINRSLIIYGVVVIVIGAFLFRKSFISFKKRG